VARLRTPVSAADHAEGPATAPVTLVEYGDYECPHCGRAYPIVKRLQETFKKRLRFVFRNFPIAASHPHAVHAAAAAEAAGLQDRFWPMHDRLFEHQPHLEDASLVRYAEQLDLDLAQFEADFDSEAVAARIEADLESGARSGVNGTPTFFVNGLRVDAGYDYDSLAAVIEAALDAAPS
jgi:protein-disulfide isomerase